MSYLLIRGIEMPEHCAMCLFHGRMDDPMVSQHWCGINGSNILNPYKGRLDDCPIVLVKPHGRLIDADALISRIRPPDSNDTIVGCTIETVKQLMSNAICNAETIIPANE